jgi:hypothetical protein
MNTQEFVAWLRGFSEAVHDYHITPAQWDKVKDKLRSVKSNEVENLRNETIYATYDELYRRSNTSTTSVPEQKQTKDILHD